MEFRQMRRFKQQLPDEDCVTILNEAYRGFLSVVGDGGYPYTIPINFVYADGHIYFHCAQEGHKIDALKTCDKACFSVIDEPVREPGDWWYHVRSVVCFGRISFVEEPSERLAKLRMVGKKYFPEGYDMENDIQRNGSRAAILDMKIEHMTGKQVKEN
ncbi:MAG: pyridoxamine 5'-phosphate oxidase family protein [Bacteroidales bacterium]|nr:pyridoxamine 5'-phosphate oxidase family protein [Bacteroidales bacterium]